MDIISMEYEIEMAKIDNYFENAVSTYINDGDYAFAITESTCDEDTLDYLLTEASEKFTEKVKKVFDAIIEAIKSFIKKMQTEFRIRMEQRKIRKKLNEIEALMKKSPKIAAIKVKGYEKSINKDIHSFMKEYKKTANMMIRLCYEINECDSIDKIKEKQEKVVEVAKDFIKQAILFSTTVEPTIGKNTYIVDKEIADVNKMLEEIAVVTNKHVQTIESIALKAEEKDAAPAKVSALKSVATHLSSMAQKVAKAISDHPIVTLATITGTLAAAGYTISNHNNPKVDIVYSPEKDNKMSYDEYRTYMDNNY